MFKSGQTIRLVLLNDEEICDKQIVSFYELVASKFGIEIKEESQFNCCEIEIAENIQENMYETYRKLVKARIESKEIPFVSDSQINTEITMLLAMSGAKVNPELKPNEVIISELFVD